MPDGSLYWYGNNVASMSATTNVKTLGVSYNATYTVTNNTNSVKISASGASTYSGVSYYTSDVVDTTVNKVLKVECKGNLTTYNGADDILATSSSSLTSGTTCNKYYNELVYYNAVTSYTIITITNPSEIPTGLYLGVTIQLMARSSAEFEMCRMWLE